MDNLTLDQILEALMEAMGAAKTNTVFRPVRTNEEALKTREAVNGFVYFTTDSKKIYLGHNNKFIPVGGSSGVYYADKEITEADLSYNVFTDSDIEGTQMPQTGDLIINVGSNVLYNGFYKVTSVIDDRQVVADYLPVGGGGGGGGGSTGGGGGSAKIQFVQPTTAYDTTIAGNKYVIRYKLDAKDANGDPIITKGTANWKVNGRAVGQKDMSVDPTKDFEEFDVTNYLDANRTTNEIRVDVLIDTGGSIKTTASKTWNIKAVNLKLEWDLKLEHAFFDEDTFPLTWKVYGGVDAITHIIFDNNMKPNEGYFQEPIPARKANGTDYPKVFDSLGYGVHTVEMYVSAVIEGRTERTDSIFYEIAFTKGGTTPLLLVPFYQKTATQYDTLKIPFMVYDPLNPTAYVEYLVNGVFETGNNFDREQHEWPYVVPQAGHLELGLKCGESLKTLSLDVTKLELDITEPGSPVFKFKASDFSGNTQIKEWKGGSNKNIGIEFSENFDWKNGGLQTEEDENGNNRKFICVKNNTYMTIDYQLFKSYFPGAGKLFKIIFKATNCYDYGAKILDCYDENSKIGLTIDAQKAVFRGGGEILSTQFCEDSYIELELEIWPDTTDALNGDRYLMFWVDGVPTAVRTYAHGIDFTQTANTAKKIVIGSPDCDVNIYLVKVYESYLDKDAHVDNFILDASSVEDMLARNSRNDVLGLDGNISWERVVEQNPSLPVHLYDIPRMTRTKKDKVPGCVYEQYKQTAAMPVIKCADATIKVQGTSSAAYGVAAFNIDTDFNASMTDGEGNLLKYFDANNRELEEYRGFWAMRANSIPVDFTCTKVNVASCENANNAVNAEWYNRFQPYWDGHRRKNPKARDCMEFIPGLMFIRDRNTVGNGDIIYDDEGKPITDGHSSNAYRNVYSDDVNYMKLVHQLNNGEIDSNLLPYRQYAVCNMGNSKDNVHVFHDESNPKAYCVEVTDNQNTEHWMTVEANLEAFEEIKTGPKPHKEYYEFRYPEDATDEMKNEWLKFEHWMAKNDPSPYDETNHPNGYKGDLLPAPVTFPVKEFQGFNPPGFDDSTASGVTLKGLKISRYAGTYTEDTKEYRIAKMLHECENYMVMDSVVYHYLFIERHTMVDNVAKNTFWSTEDGIHWDLTKNYDNDTADGNNNTGYLVYSYGIECMDNENDEEGGIKKVFNAAHSVWFNFIHELTEAQEHLFAQLESKGAWSASSYLNAFKEYQEVIPERCWVEDYFRKYIRPRRLDLDQDTYLKRLEGGKKTHQRKQYETYQEYYMGSKYEAGIGQSQAESIDTRLNTGEKFNENTIIPITTYIDCYPRAVIGGNTAKKRIKRGERYEIPIGSLVTSGNDATAYWYPATYIQTMDNISTLYPLTVNFNSAKKLRKINVGDEDSSYLNTYLSTAKFESNTMLEELNVANAGVRSETQNLGSLTLADVKSLKKINISGSSYSRVQFAEGCLLEEAYINGVEEFRAKSLSNLKKIEFDKEAYTPGDTKFVNNIYKNLINLYVTDCPAIDTYDLVKNCNIQKYELINIDWTITDNSLSDGMLVNIDVLDKLLRVSEGLETATLLTGKIKIKMDCSADEYQIYTKYCKKYPNLTIEYEISDLNPAVKLEFYNNDEIENAKVHYTVLGSGDTEGFNALTIQQLVSAAGPLGIEMGNPLKPETKSHTYTFSHYWSCGDKIYYDSTVTNPIDGTFAFASVYPEESMAFYPVFNAEDRWYDVRFYVDGNIVQQDRGDGVMADAHSVKYNSKYDGKMKNYYYKEHSISDMRYKFLGWSTDPASRDPKFSDVENYYVTEHTNFYAYFEEESVYESPTSYDYFNISGTELRGIKDTYRDVIQGKITIPLKTKAGVALTSIGEDAFANLPKVTHIYFQSGNSSYTEIKARAFKRDYKMVNPAVLKAVYLPEGIVSIGNSCFFDQSELEVVTLPESVTSIGQEAFSCDVNSPDMKVHISSLPSGLISIGTKAFFRGGPNITISSIPIGVFKISQNVFAFCSNVAVGDFGTNAANSGLQIDLAAFYKAGTSVANPPRIINFYSSVEFVDITSATHSFADSYLAKASTINIYNLDLFNNIDKNHGGIWPGTTIMPTYLDPASN